jgi:hypothetical protein
MFNYWTPTGEVSMFNYWTMEKIEEALNRVTIAASAGYPVEQVNELLLIAGDMLELVERANAYKERIGKPNIYTYPEFIELFENALQNYPQGSGEQGEVCE